jgi:hypothetical protein
VAAAALRAMLTKKLLTDPFGATLVSVILGLGLAALFRKVCKGDNCVVVQAPSAKDLEKYVYQIDTSCYKYTPNVVHCD